VVGELRLRDPHVLPVEAERVQRVLREAHLAE
jgi:hypothetical protein